MLTLLIFGWIIAFTWIGSVRPDIAYWITTGAMCGLGLVVAWIMAGLIGEFVKDCWDVTSGKIRGLWLSSDSEQKGAKCSRN
jgi:hypothetical protein